MGREPSAESVRSGAEASAQGATRESVGRRLRVVTSLRISEADGSERLATVFINDAQLSCVVNAMEEQGIDTIQYGKGLFIIHVADAPDDEPAAPKEPT